MMVRRKSIIGVAIILLVLLVDQLLKIWVKTNFYLGEAVEITPWFNLLFVQNNGMAFGIEIGSKLFLTIFRIVAVIFGSWYLCRIIKNSRFPIGYIVCVALILAGAAGNIIDCLFYGLIFNNPMPPEVATLFPAEGGYSSLFHGLVVDMLYFPLFTFVWPEWMPWVGGQEFLFFQPVFNIADSAITVGILTLLLFYSKYFAESTEKEAAEKTVETETDEEVR